MKNLFSHSNTKTSPQLFFSPFDSPDIVETVEAEIDAGNQLSDAQQTLLTLVGDFQAAMEFARLDPRDPAYEEAALIASAIGNDHFVTLQGTDTERINRVLAQLEAELDAIAKSVGGVSIAEIQAWDQLGLTDPRVIRHLEASGHTPESLAQSGHDLPRWGAYNASVFIDYGLPPAAVNAFPMKFTAGEVRSLLAMETPSGTVVDGELIATYPDYLDFSNLCEWVRNGVPGDEVDRYFNVVSHPFEAARLIANGVSPTEYLQQTPTQKNASLMPRNETPNNKSS